MSDTTNAAPPESRSAEPTDLQEIARCLYLTDRQIYDRTYGGMEGETWETAPATSRANFEKYAAAILARGFHRAALAHPEAPLAEEERPGPLTETDGPHSCTEPNCKRCEKRPGEFCGDDDCNCGAPGNHAAQTPMTREPASVVERPHPQDMVQSLHEDDPLRAIRRRAKE